MPAITIQYLFMTLPILPLFHVCVYLHVCTCMHVCMHVCSYVFMYVLALMITRAQNYSIQACGLIEVFHYHNIETT